MPARSGADFLRGLRDGRELWIGGQRVTDPMDHPALHGAAESIAAVYENLLQFFSSVIGVFNKPNGSE